MGLHRGATCGYGSGKIIEVTKSFNGDIKSVWSGRVAKQLKWGIREMKRVV